MASIRVFSSLARTSRPCAHAYTITPRRIITPTTNRRLLRTTASLRNEKKGNEAATTAALEKMMKETAAALAADQPPGSEVEGQQGTDIAASQKKDENAFWDEFNATLDTVKVNARTLEDEENDYGYVVPRTGEEATDDPFFPEWESDDMSSTAHGELDRHREARHYARIMVYEMPKLSKLSVPFQPPTQNEVLRFRYTTYMGVQHPAEPKVVVEFDPEDFGLTTNQKNKLIKLCGVRYNPAKKLVKISCEMFKEQAQNRQYLGTLVESLVREAKDAGDNFKDVPFDFRHHKTKLKRPWFWFPKNWRVTDQKLRMMRWTHWNKANEAQREQSLQLNAANEAEGKRITQTKKDYVAFLRKQQQQVRDREMLEMTSAAAYDRIGPTSSPARTIQMAPVANVI